MILHRLPEATVAALTALPAFRGGAVVATAPQPGGRSVGVGFADGRRVVVSSAVPGDGSPGSLAHEATVLGVLFPMGLPVPRPVTTLTGAASTVLVTEDLPGREPLARRREAAGGTSTAWAAAVGAALGRIHEARGCGVPDRLPRTDPARRLLQTWTVVTPRDIAARGDGFADLVRHLRRADLLDALAEATSGWSSEELIHGDVTLARVVCAPDPEDERPLWFTGWGTAGRGDPRWDVGSLLGDYLYAWLSRAELAADDGLDTWTVPADPPFGTVRAEICAAVEAYTAERPVSPGDRRQWVRYAGFALVRRVVTAALTSTALPPRSLDHLQMAGQLLRRPELSGEMLLCP